MNVEKNIEILRIIAEDIAPVSNARLAAMILYRGKIVALGTNQSKTHPQAAKYGRLPSCNSLHAEVDVINKAKKKITESQMKKSTLIVVRVKKDIRKKNIFGISKPCSGCEKCILDHGIRTVIYTEDSVDVLLKYTTVLY